METGLLGTFNQLIQSHPGWLIAMAFFFALLESLAIIGIFIPGIILLFIVGAVIGTDVSLFVWCWISAAAGALCGDVISHWVGYRFRDRVPRMWLLRRRPDLLMAGRDSVMRHGGKGIVLGRFIGPLRAVVPMVAGMMGMPLKSFLVFAVPACLLWAPAYLLPGMLFGASLELAAEFAGRLVVVLLILVLGLWLVIWLTRVVYNFTARRSGWWLKGLIRWSSDHPLMGWAVSPLFEPGKREMLSVALLGMLLVVSLALLLTVLVLAPIAAGAWDAERQVAGWAASLRSHFADPLFVALSLAGDMRVMGLLAAAMTLVLISFGRVNAAWHWLVATAGGWILAELLNGFMGLLIESPALMPSLGEVPHRGITLSTIVLGFFAVMLAKDLNANRRKWPYLATTAMLALICFANFYLGRASLSGLVAALALGAGWLALVGIGYRQRALSRQHPGVLTTTFYALLVGIAAVHIQANHEVMLETSRLAQPERVMLRTHWLEAGWRELPERRSRIGRAVAQRFDLQVAGDLGVLREQLEAAGWHTPREPEGRRLAMMLTSRPDPASLPHLPRDFAGRPENLILIHPVADGRVAVLRLWSSGARLLPGDDPVWLGQVRFNQVGRFLGMFNRWTEVAAGSDQAMALMRGALDRVAMVEVAGGVWLMRVPESHDPIPIPDH